MKYITILVIIIFIIVACQKAEEESGPDNYRLSNEKHLKNIRMLTSEGENAEAYFSFNKQKLIYQSRHGKYLCDQIFTMNLDGSDKKLVSTGLGRTTCSFYYPGDQKIIYASTHAVDSDCPPPPDFSQGYVWKVYSSFDLYTANSDGSNPVSIVPADGYDAEATVSPKGDKVVFTSQRSGDLEIYSMNLDGTELNQLTNTLGYDGGPFYSWDGSKIVYRSYHPKTEKQIERYKDLLKDELIEPAKFQIWVMNADGSNKRQVTDNDYANFAPFYHPDNQRIIFCSNLNSENPRQPDFNLWMINEDGSGLEQITYFDKFDGFPMFSPDKKQLVFASNRFNRQPRDTNVFIADWIE
jgi:Tol biopolymer transport system component